MSSLFIFALILVATLLSFTNFTKLSRSALIFTLICFASIGSGWIPSLLLKPLQAPFVSFSKLKWKNNNVIVLLGGGNVLFPVSKNIIPSIKAYSRIHKAAELYFACINQKHKCRILISGGLTDNNNISEGLVYEKALIKLGVNHDDFILETNSTNTHQNAQFTHEILQKENVDQIILVTSGIHLKRSLLWFNFFQMNSLPIPADYQRASRSIMSIGNNFAITDYVLHEYLGIIKFYLDTTLIRRLNNT